MKKTKYTDAILEARFRARARLAIAWETYGGTSAEVSPTEQLKQMKNEFVHFVEWVHGKNALHEAVQVLKEYPLTSRRCPYDREERKNFSLWLTCAEWDACRAKLIALRKWKLIDIEPSACDDGIYLAVEAREEAKFVINHIIVGEVF